MKKTYVILAFIFGMITTSFSQMKTSGDIILTPDLTVKIDLNQTTNLATLTTKSKDGNWFGVGFSNSTFTPGSGMPPSIDCVVLRTPTTLSDSRTRTTGRGNPDIDTAPESENWMVTSNTVTSDIRTIVATRPFSTLDVNDYVFDFNASTVNLIWAHTAPGSTAPATVQYHETNRGYAVANFSTTLGTDDFATLGAIEVLPNPSKNGMFSVSRNNLVSISKIKIFDTTAKLLKSQDVSRTNQSENVDLTGMAKGIYFMELSNDNDKTVKKIIIE
jgi:Secretion system C-terminal sorting domain